MPDSILTGKTTVSSPIVTEGFSIKPETIAKALTGPITVLTALPEGKLLYHNCNFSILLIDIRVML